MNGPKGSAEKELFFPWHFLLWINYTFPLNNLRNVDRFLNVFFYFRARTACFLILLSHFLVCIQAEQSAEKDWRRGWMEADEGVDASNAALSLFVDQWYNRKWIIFLIHIEITAHSSSLVFSISSRFFFHFPRKLNLKIHRLCYCCHHPRMLRTKYKDWIEEIGNEWKIGYVRDIIDNNAGRTTTTTA